jgi:hypothetical protein
MIFSKEKMKNILSCLLILFDCRFQDHECKFWILRTRSLDKVYDPIHPMMNVSDRALFLSMLTPFGVNKQEYANRAKKQSRRRHRSDRSGVPVRPVS